MSAARIYHTGIDKRRQWGKLFRFWVSCTTALNGTVGLQQAFCLEPTLILMKLRLKLRFFDDLFFFDDAFTVVNIFYFESLSFDLIKNRCGAFQMAGVGIFGMRLLFGDHMIWNGWIARHFWHPVQAQVVMHLLDVTAGHSGHIRGLETFVMFIETLWFAYFFPQIYLQSGTLDLLILFHLRGWSKVKVVGRV